ncbi:MAG TPA: hypothetical protein VJU79_05825 [Candidatus Dormibacteraeota bacterium]|nr:hypothetical protein [Candidatus Dormibacteraeota bacterium]
MALGNERLTAVTAVALLALLAVEGVTIVFLRQLLAVHFFVGALLIPPVALKLGSTGYRFARYYLGSGPYVAKGPPHIVLRSIAPIVVISTLVVFGTGIALMVAGPSTRDALLPFHKISFIVWIAFTGVHVLGHVLELPRPVRADLGRDARLPGRSLRLMLVSVALAVGTAMGLWALSYTGPWQNTF